MKFERLEISRSAAYATPANTIQGCLELKSEHGSQTITLSSTAISAILTCISAEVVQTAKANAKAVAKGMENAIVEPTMLTQLEQTLLEVSEL